MCVLLLLMRSRMIAVPPNDKVREMICTEKCLQRKKFERDLTEAYNILQRFWNEQTLSGSQTMAAGSTHSPAEPDRALSRGLGGVDSDFL